MNELQNTYFDEAEDFLQTAEESLLRLEQGYSEEEINTLFRVMHSLKGSSALFDFQEIVKLAHKLEDMLDMIRTGKLSIDRYIINICFDSIDELNNLVRYRKVARGNKPSDDLLETQEQLVEKISKIINSSEDEAKDEEDLAIKKGNCKYEENKFDERKNILFINVIFNDNSVLLPVRRFVFFSKLLEIGIIDYSNCSQNLMTDIMSKDETINYMCILSTDYDKDAIYEILSIEGIDSVYIVDIKEHVIDETKIMFSQRDAELLEIFFYNLRQLSYIIFELSELEKVNKYLLKEKVDKAKEFCAACLDGLKFKANTRKIMKLKENIIGLSQLLFIIADDSKGISYSSCALMQKLLIEMIEEIYNVIGNRLYIKSIKISDRESINLLLEVVNNLNNERFKKLFVDISSIDIIEYVETMLILEAKKILEDKGVELCLINNGIYRKRIYNIFETINDGEGLWLYYSVAEAVMGFNWGSRRKYLKLEEDYNEKECLQDSNCG